MNTYLALSVVLDGLACIFKFPVVAYSDEKLTRSLLE